MQLAILGRIDPETLDVTVAVSVADPTPDNDVSAVEVAATLTVCIRTVEVLLPKVVLPPYTAVILCVPAGGRSGADGEVG